MAQGSILLTFFLKEHDSLFASRQMQLLKIAAAQELGNNCKREPNSVKD